MLQEGAPHRLLLLISTSGLEHACKALLRGGIEFGNARPNIRHSGSRMTCLPGSCPSSDEAVADPCDVPAQQLACCSVWSADRRYVRRGTSVTAIDARFASLSSVRSPSEVHPTEERKARPTYS